MIQRRVESTSLFFFLFFFPFGSFAQQVKLNDSYSQSWSGGIAGRHGENFIFVIEFTGIKEDISPDTIWIGDQTIPLLITDSQLSDSKNTKRIRKKHAIKFEIHAGTYFDDYEYINMLSGDEKKRQAAHPPYSYIGVALLSYIYKGKKRYFEISKIMRRGEPVAYP